MAKASTINNTSVEYDMSELTRRVSLLTGMLCAKGGQIEQVLKSETGQLAGRLGDAAGPKTLEAATKKLDNQIKGTLTILPLFSNLDESQSYSSRADFTWLYSWKGGIAGINDEDNQTGVSGEDALVMFSIGQKTNRGKAWVDLGRRGGVKVMRLNRTRVSRSAFNFVRRTILEKTGQLRASFYCIAKKYVPTKSVPAWIIAKFDAVEANGKSRLNEMGLNGTPEQFIEFTISSKGVENNPFLVAKFQGAIKATSISIQAKLGKIGDGAKYVFETGQVYFEK